MDQGLNDVVESGPELLADGFGFTEGPLWHPDGHWEFVDIRKNTIHGLRPGGKTETVRENSGGSNGMTFDLQGNVIVCEGDNRRITRREANGSYTTIAEQIGGKKIHRPNDIICRSDGSLYFSDLGGRLAPQDRVLDYNGVHRIAPDGSVSNATSDTEFPNGLAFSPDESILYVAITRLDDTCIQEKERGEICHHQFIRAFDVAADGSLSNNRVFADMFSKEDGVPDGMKVDVEGRIYCTGSEGCWVFDSSGNHLGIIRLPEIPANCAWGGPDNKTLFFTARTSVFTMQMKTAGTPIHRA